MGSLTAGESAVHTGLSWILATQVFVFFGRISYAIYLWHLPILVFLVEASFYDSLGRLPTRLLALALTLAAAIASYCLVEQRLARATTHDADFSPRRATGATLRSHPGSAV